MPHSPLAAPVIRTLLGRPGPFASAYVDATRATESGPHEIEVRWAEVRASLEEQGCPAETIEAMGAEVEADRYPGRHGLAVVATGGNVGFAAPLHTSPPVGVGRVAPLPWLMPYLADRAAAVPYIVVAADRTGADLLHVDRGGETETRRVSGDTPYPVHRTATADWSERHFQLRVENAWQSNARDVAGAVHRLVAEFATTLVIVAGDVRARSMIADDLTQDPHLEVRDVEAGGRGEPAALRAAAEDQMRHHVWRERRATLEHLQQNLGRERYAVAGVQRVVDALRSAQADTVIVSDDPSSTLRSWVGDRPTDFGLDDAEAASLGVTDPGHDRFDSALVRAAAGTGADLLITPGAHDYVTDGIAALLRSDTV